MSRRPTLRPCLETLESVTLLSSLPLHPQPPAVVHTEVASNMPHELDQLPLTGASIAGGIEGKFESKGKKYELLVNIGHFFAVGQQTINSSTPISGVLDYTVTTKNAVDRFAFKSGQIVIHKIGTTDQELELKLTLPKDAKGENASDVTQFVYSVAKADKFFAGTKAQGNKLLSFAQLWPNPPAGSQDFSGIFS